LNAEDGPADLVVRVRSMLGNTMAGRLMDCFYCLSLWIAFPVTLPLSRSVPEGVLTWLALSGGACLLHGVVKNHVVVESSSPQTPEGGTEDVLWSDAHADETPRGEPTPGRQSKHG
jgi:hypothetical protein